MKNEYGLDVSYFESKLKLVVRDCSRYTPEEMSRELTRLAIAANHKASFDENYCHFYKLMDVKK